MLTVEIKRRRKQSALSVDCLAVIVDDRAVLYAVLEDGGRKKLAWRVGTSGQAWQAIDGSKTYPPLIHDPVGDSVLHFRSAEYADGKSGDWTFSGRPDTNIMNLRRRGDQTTTPNFCYLASDGWGKHTTDIAKGESQIMIAPADFSLEELHLSLANKGTRGRLSVLAGWIMICVQLETAPFAGDPGGYVRDFAAEAVVIDANARLYLVKDGVRQERLVGRHLVEPDVWIGLGGSRLLAPVIRGPELGLLFAGTPLPLVADSLSFQTRRSEDGDPRGLDLLDNEVGGSGPVYLTFEVWRRRDLERGVREIVIARWPLLLELAQQAPAPTGARQPGLAVR